MSELDKLIKKQHENPEKTELQKLLETCVVPESKKFPTATNGDGMHFDPDLVQRRNNHEFGSIIIDDNFGAKDLLKKILPQSHHVDIRVRLNGQYYWFEGDFLKEIFKKVSFNRIEHDITATLDDHKERGDHE